MRVRVLAPILAALLLASCSSTRVRPYEAQHAGFLAPVDYRLKAAAAAQRIYPEYRIHEYPVIATDVVTKKTEFRTVQTVEVIMERPAIKATKQTPKQPRVTLQFEFSPEGYLLGSSHQVGTAMARRQEFAYLNTDKRVKE